MALRSSAEKAGAVLVADVRLLAVFLAAGMGSPEG
jgi:hypothetical protein